MKLVIVLLTTCLMQVSAASFAQKITFKKQGATLSQIFREIKAQTGYNVFYSNEKIDKDKKVDANFKNTDLKAVLDEIANKHNLDYAIDAKNISIKPKEPSFLYNLVARFANIEVRGKVVSEDGSGLAGATVKVKGISKSVTTDTNGNFYLKGVEETAVLEISYVGYKMKEVKAKRELGEIKMEMSSGELEEVTINKGYYSTTKELNTGSVSIIKGEAIERQNIANPLLALHGQVTGLYVSQGLGTPGSTVRINIRGINSIANGREPFYVIDGVPFNSTPLLTNTQLSTISPFSSINPADIERIEVLKDADATAIYGSRGANGVILISTKKGVGGKATLKVDISSGIGRVTRMLDLMNTEEFIMMREEAFKNDNAAPQGTDFDVNGTWSKEAFTDWQREMIGGTAQINNANATLSGGNQQFNYLLGGHFRRETTVYPGDFRNIVGSFNSNIGYVSPSRKIRVNYSGSFANNDITLPLEDMTQFAIIPPNSPAVNNSKGELNWENLIFPNPYGIIKRRSKSVSQSLINSLNITFDLPLDLKLKTNLGFNQNGVEDERWIPFESYDPTTSDPGTNRLYYLGGKKIQTFIAEPQITYNNTFGRHKFDALIATTIQQTSQKGNSLSSYGYAQDALIGNLSASTTIKATSSDADYKYNAIFGRVGYSYNNRYTLNLTARRDGSSRFGPGRQFGNFGAIGAAWIFSHEAFFSESKWLTFGKLRASVGRTGNDQLGDYQYLRTYSAQYIYFGTSGLGPTQHINPNYGWENIDKMEVGLELGFWQNRLFINGNIYRHRTGNQLVSFPTPYITGFNSVKANLPAVIQNRGLELDISSVNLKTQKFSWRTQANLTIPKNKLLSFPGIEKTSYATQYAVGQPLNISYLYTYKGIDPATGVYIFEDIDGDGSITFNKDRRPVFLGQKYFGGLTNSFNYGNWSVDVILQYVKQTGANYDVSGSPGILFSGNQPKAAMKRWQSTAMPGNGQIQRFSQDYGDAYIASDNFSFSDARIVDASFIRMKTLMIGYHLPSKWKAATRLSDGKIFFQGQNLFTITNYSGLDPENAGSAGQSTPSLAPLKVLSFGLQLIF